MIASRKRRILYVRIFSPMAMYANRLTRAAERADCLSGKSWAHIAHILLPVLRMNFCHVPLQRTLYVRRRVGVFMWHWHKKARLRCTIWDCDSDSSTTGICVNSTLLTTPQYRHAVSLLQHMMCPLSLCKGRPFYAQLSGGISAYGTDRWPMESRPRCHVGRAASLL